MAYSVMDVSKYVVCYSNEKNYGITNLRLQKILYFIQAYFLKLTNHPCFHEDIEAWDFGPVIPCVYHAYKKFGAAQIPDYSTPIMQFKKERDKKIIEGVINLLSKYSTSKLVEITHHQSPWIESYEPCVSNVISIKSIERFIDEQSSKAN